MQGKREEDTAQSNVLAFRSGHNMDTDDCQACTADWYASTDDVYAYTDNWGIMRMHAAHCRYPSGRSSFSDDPVALVLDGHEAHQPVSSIYWQDLLKRFTIAFCFWQALLKRFTSAFCFWQALLKRFTRSSQRGLLGALQSAAILQRHC